VTIKIKVPRAKRGPSRKAAYLHLGSPVVRAATATFIIVFLIGFAVFAYYYVQLQQLIDARMKGPLFANAAKIYATPRSISPGDKLSQSEVISQLRKAGYVEGSSASEAKLGTFHASSRGLEVRPGAESFHSPDGALISFENGAISKIVAPDNGQPIGEYELEPLLVTGLFDPQARSKRRLVTYDEIPLSLVNAVISIEDRRFFTHSGINYWRFMQAAVYDVLRGKRAQGGSTLTMQISRGFFLSPEKKITRKIKEMMIATELEQRYSKKQIFEFYANQINMGQRGSFSIDGLGEASQAYFGKDIKNLTLPESALLAGMIQRPNYFSPYKHPERAMERRNLVLTAMVETNSITQDEADRAKATPLKLSAPNVEASDAPYFVDMVKDSLQGAYTEEQLSEDGLRIYTTIDPELQSAAAEAVASGMKNVDELLAKRRTHKKKAAPPDVAPEGEKAQVALIALDPDSGEVRALVGGRNYGFSQLNHAVAKRPTGSIFKPFVYAAAINTALTGDQPVVTAASLVDNTPSSFAYEDKVYEPRNYGKDQYNEIVTARFALAHSLNNATVKIAEQVGYDKVADLAHAAGISSVRATPAMALGSYDATPMDMAGAFTIFANKGVRVSPVMIKSIRNAQGEVLQDFKAERKPVLDPRVAYVMTNMMEAVINNGTAAGVRARGFAAPAAGKTGTSHDAWFAGYTSNLLCIVWVGLDNYDDLKEEGAHTAAPIWADFMKKAVSLPAYHDAKPFDPPAGVVNLTLDKVTNNIATATCPDDYNAAFIEGTEPKETCDRNDHRGIFSKMFGLGGETKPQVLVSNAQQQAGGQPGQAGAQANNPNDDSKKKKGFFGRLLGVFKDDKDKSKQQPPPPPKPQ
jgi:penicillin-binding protein 1B